MVAKDVGEQVARARIAGRSPLYQWLWDHYDELAPQLDVKGAPWKATAEVYGKNTGRAAPTRGAVRQAWRLVRASKQRVGARVSARPDFSSLSPVASERGPDSLPGDDDLKFTDLSGRRL